MRIAGEKTDADWQELKARIVADHSNADWWQEAYDEFYKKRIDTRYLDPIRAIDDRQCGEGFAITALICTLFEFLETCEQGKNFRMQGKGEALAEHEYSQRDAHTYFEAFLEQTPFRGEFPTKLIKSFYKDVRCGLLHEARTKGGWLISSNCSPRLVEEVGPSKTLYRRRLVELLNEYFSDYRRRLLENRTTQEAFIRKFDFLCTQ